MKRDSENDCEALRRLMALKRHEQPPPRYFNDFSSRVIARIEAGERGEEDVGWWQRFWGFLEAKPAFSGAFGAAVCAVLISGMLTAGDGQGTPALANEPHNPPFVPGLVAHNDQEHLPAVSSTNGSDAVREMFEKMPLRAVPASYPQPFGFPQNR